MSGVEHARKVAEAHHAAHGDVGQAFDAGLAVLRDVGMLHDEPPPTVTIEEAASWLARTSRHPRYTAAADPAAAVLASDIDVDLAARNALANNPGDASVAATVQQVRATLLAHVRGEQ